MARKISVIGCGKVGATAAYALALADIADELVVIDVDTGRARGEALDLSHGAAYTGTSVTSGDFKDIKDSDVIIFAAGVGRKPGESRFDLAVKNVTIARGVAADIKKYYNGGVVLCVTNPVDLITYIMTEELKLPAGKVIGTGTALDTARFKDGISKKLKIAKEDIMTCILGEHGDSSVPIWEMTSVNALTLYKYCEAEGIVFDEKVKDEIIADMKTGGADIIALKGATFYGIGSAITLICKAILSDSRTLMPISAKLNGEYGLKDTAISLLGIVGRPGLIRFLTPDIGSKELTMLKDSAARVKAEIGKL